MPYIVAMSIASQSMSWNTIITSEGIPNALTQSRKERTMYSDESIKWDRKQAQALLLLLDKISAISGQIEDNIKEMESDEITDER